MSGILFVVSGPSGAGKSTMCTRLRNEFPSVAISRSVTSRALRAGETDGVDYDFVTAAAFEQMIDEGAFVEWARVHDNYYGTTRNVVDGLLAEQRDVLFDVDYQGAEGIRSMYPRAVTVMLLPPSYQTLEARLRGRNTDAHEVIKRRMENARGEVAQLVDFDYVIVNDELECAYEKLRSVFISARCRPWEQRELLARRFAVEMDENVLKLRR